MPTNSTPESPDTPRSILRGSHAWAVNRFGQYMRSSRFWMVVASCTLVAAIAGPFDTLNTMSFGLRLPYWTAVLFPAIVSQFYLSLILREIARRSDQPWGLASFLAGCFGAGFILGWVAFLQVIIFPPDLRTDAATLFFWVCPVVLSLTVVINAFMPTLQPLWGFRRTSGTQTRRQQTYAPLALAADASPLFDRLPPDLGRDVICIRADNHHIEVTTTRGHARILMRLADAQADLATLPGLRVHRSWWVNLTMVSHTQTRQGAMDLILSTGVRVPVSRALRATVTEHLANDAAE